MKLQLNKENATEEELLIVETFNNLGDMLLYEINLNPKGYLLIESYKKLENWMIKHKWNNNLHTDEFQN